MRGLYADGDLLRDLRKRRGLTQEDLANRADVDVRTVRNAESGKPIDVATLGAIATALEVDLEAILRGPDESKSGATANVERIHAWKVAFERGDLEAIVALYREDAVLRYPPPIGECVGVAAIREHYRLAIESFAIEPAPPERVRIHAAEDYVLFRARAWGTVRATGRRFESDVVHEFRLAGGWIVLEVGTYDVKSLLDALAGPSEA